MRALLHELWERCGITNSTLREDNVLGATRRGQRGEEG